VTEVARQAVRDVDGRMRQALFRQGAAQRHARRGRVHARRRRQQVGWRQLLLHAVAGQRQARVAHGAADPDVVARHGSAAAQGLARRQFAEHGDAEI